MAGEARQNVVTEEMTSSTDTTDAKLGGAADEETSKKNVNKISKNMGTAMQSLRGSWNVA